MEASVLDLGLLILAIAVNIGIIAFIKRISKTLPERKKRVWQRCAKVGYSLGLFFGLPLAMFMGGEVVNGSSGVSLFFFSLIIFQVSVTGAFLLVGWLLSLFITGQEREIKQEDQPR